VQRASLTSHATKSCGCFFSESVAARARTHGGSKWPEYKVWAGIVQRCENRNSPAYADYGGRGITLCDRWRKSFADFIADVGRRPVGHELDRINNNGNYEPGNVRWVTRAENNQNRSFITRQEAEELKAKIAAYEEKYGRLA